MDWLKKLFGIKTNFEIMLDHLRASHERDNELIRLQMATIDRVVAARFDRPTYAAPEPVASPSITPEDLIDVNVDDETFLDRLQ